MAKIANKLTINIPGELNQRLSVVAQKEGVTIEQLALYIFTKEVGLLEAKNAIYQYHENYSADGILQDFDSVMSKVAEMPVQNWDSLD